MSTIRLTASQALVRFLDHQFIEFDGVVTKFVEGVFGIFGHGCVLGLGEALQEPNHDLKFYQGHSEQGMGHAAIAFSKQHNRRKIMAVLSSIGPGALNMVTAAGTATVNRIPVLFLPGDSFACRQPDPVLQQIEMPHDYTLTANDAFKPVSRYWDRITRPEQLMNAVLNAMRVLTNPAEAGAVTLAFPQDVQSEAYEYPREFFEKRIHRIARRPLALGDAERLAKLISKKKKPMILCGGGVRYSEAGKSLAKFAQQFHIPFAETQTGKGCIEWNHPYNLGGIGVTGSLAANEIAHQADFVLAIGSRLNDFVTASKWNFQHANVEIGSLNLCDFDAYKMHAHPFLGDAKLGLEALGILLAKEHYKTSWGTDLEEVLKKWTAEVDRLYTLDDTAHGIMQTKILGLLNEGGIPEDAIVVAAAGSLPSDMERLWRSRVKDTYHLEYGFSCMGYEIAGALGAKIAEPKREVYCLVGDGSFLMLNSEMFTARQEGLKINIILVDNNGFQCIDSLQTSQGIPHFGCEFKYRNEKAGMLDGDWISIDYSQIAAGLGYDSWQVRSSEEFTQALKEARKSKNCTLIDCKAERKSMTGGYSTWWRVEVPEVSNKDTVIKAQQEMHATTLKARKL